MSRRICHNSPDEQGPEIFKAFDFFECSEILEFQTEKHISDDYATFALPFWMCASSKDTECEVSHVLLDNPYPSQPRSTSSSLRFPSFSDGKKVLMELIQNIPESSYELSLRDIIDDQKSPEEGQDGLIIEGNSICKAEDIKLPQLNKNFSRGQISPNESMNKVFLLKMFIPVSFRLKTKRIKIIRNRSKVPKPCSERREEKKCKNISHSRFSISSCKSRLVESNFLSCWRFFCKRI